MEVASRVARAMRQKNQVELNLGTGMKGEAPEEGTPQGGPLSIAAAREAEARAAQVCLERPAVAEPSMEAVVERENLKKALAQVKRNKGAAGGLTSPLSVTPAFRNPRMSLRMRVHLLFASQARAFDVPGMNEAAKGTRRSADGRSPAKT
jgi:hypothetical protein